MTTVQHAREALGQRLREIRRGAGLTGYELAERLGWPQSKISKLETARQTPSESDLRAWCTGCDHEGELAGLLASLRTLESRHAEWQRTLRAGARGHQADISALDARTKLFKAFEPAAVPGLLQTADYARARFAEVIALHGIPNDVETALASRLARQQILYDRSQRFHFVMTEATLRYRTCSPDVLLSQLDRLVAATSLPNVRLGIVPFATTYVYTPVHGFWILDDRLVMVETSSAELNLAQPQEIELYGRVFAAHAAVASYGPAARKVLATTIQELQTLIDQPGATSDGEAEE